VGPGLRLLACGDLSVAGREWCRGGE